MKKMLLVILAVYMATTYANGGYYNKERADAASAEWEARFDNNPELARQRDAMRKSYAEAVASQDEADQHYDKQREIARKNIAPILIAEGCRAAVIEESILRYSNINSNFFGKAYGECLRMNGISYE